MIKYLDNVNEQEQDEENIDPRWEGLKNINKDNK
jgi:uncharacterized metal-binding protein YceD (DUF177 family)